MGSSTLDTSPIHPKGAFATEREQQLMWTTKKVDAVPLQCVHLTDAKKSTGVGVLQLGDKFLDAHDDGSVRVGSTKIGPRTVVMGYERNGKNMDMRPLGRFSDMKSQTLQSFSQSQALHVPSVATDKDSISTFQQQTTGAASAWGWLWIILLIVFVVLIIAAWTPMRRVVYRTKSGATVEEAAMEQTTAAIDYAFDVLL